MEPTKTVRNITWNPLSWFEALNPVYSEEEVAAINESLRESAAANPANQPSEPRQPFNTDRSRYSQGSPRPKRVVTPPIEQTGRDSRRGTGLSAFNPEKLTGTYGSLPASARVVTDYPKGIPTGLGGGNAAQAQSLDPEASAYIPPTRITTPDPTPPPAPKSEPNWVDWYQKDNDLGNKNIDEVKSHFASQSKGLGEWAEANPALAWRAYQKQMPDSMGALTEWNTDMDVDAPAQSVIPGRAERIQGSIDSLVKDADLNPWSQQLLENLSTGNFTNPDNLKDLDIFKSDIEVPYNFDNVPTEVFSEKGLDLKYPGIFNSTYRPVI